MPKTAEIEELQAQLESHDDVRIILADSDETQLFEIDDVRYNGIEKCVDVTVSPV